jgi:S-adenosylmethionine:tRNA ribosyltransferase-isomerase
MNVSDFSYDLPEELIAQTPISERPESRLLVMDKATGQISHRIFKDLLDFLEPGDCLVVNDTRVLPARILGHRSETGSKIEFLLLHPVSEDVWEVILKPGRRAKVGARFVFGEGDLLAEVIEIVEGGNRRVRFFYEGVFEEVLHRIGLIPLPPYITQTLEDKERYQTVYAKHNGSAAAPTAGLHFSRELLSAIEEKGVSIAPVTLHVGLGTFRPVKVEQIEDHRMHGEHFEIGQSTCDKVNLAKKSGKRVFAVGTTSVRVIESVALADGTLKPGIGQTHIFIYPGYRFLCADALITNFHLPQSTLIMLVCAFAGKDPVVAAYREAVLERYRFFSFGDAMLVL